MKNNYFMQIYSSCVDLHLSLVGMEDIAWEMKKKFFKISFTVNCCDKA